MKRLTPLQKDYYLDDHDGGGYRRSDDDDDSESSEDEIQRMFADIAGVQLPSQRKRQLKEDRSFEDEMERELDVSFRQHNGEWAGNTSSISSSKKNVGESSGAKKKISNAPSSSKPSVPTEMKNKNQNRSGKEEDVDPALGLNEQGTESDEEFQRNEGLGGPNEEDDEDLMYDSDEDDANQNWIDTHRRSYQPEANQDRPLPKSDAVLNCPACMTVLCLDCQRHEIYKTQYRAMFVKNCEVKRDELLYQPKSKKRGGVKKSKDESLSATLKSGERLCASDHDAQTIEDIKKSSHPEDLFYPVICCVCKTEVGVYDSDEIYHFFNTLASYA